MSSRSKYILAMALSKNCNRSGFDLATTTELDMEIPQTEQNGIDLATTTELDIETSLNGENGIDLATTSGHYIELTNVAVENCTGFGNDIATTSELDMEIPQTEQNGIDLATTTELDIETSLNGENGIDLATTSGHYIELTNVAVENCIGSGNDIATTSELDMEIPQTEQNGIDLATTTEIDIETSLNGENGIDLATTSGHYIELTNEAVENCNGSGSDIASTSGPGMSASRVVRNKTSIKQPGSKRRVHKDQWKCNVRKASRAAGEAYISKMGKMMAAKDLRSPCVCRMKCSEKVVHQQRLEIHKNYWNKNKSNDHKRQYIISCVENLPTKSIRKDAIKHKDKSLIYSFRLNDNQKVRVCKTMFLNTLSISNTVVITAMKKSLSGGLVEEDRRGKKVPKNKTSQGAIDIVVSHISSFPVYVSHYSRERTDVKFLATELNIDKMFDLYVEFCRSTDVPSEHVVKKWQYADIFNFQFKLSFKPPQNDTCDTCDVFSAKINDQGIDHLEKAVISQQYQAHINEADARYQLKGADTFAAKSNSGKIVLMMDLQKCLATPLLTCATSFYKRKLWTFNFTIYDASGVAHCMMWDETKASRGGEEMASALLKWAEETLPHSHDVEELILWSDNCFGQNKNIMIISCIFWILKKWPQIKVVRQNFLLKGHTHMEADTVHAVIEKKRKKLPDMSILTPWDWQQFIRGCSNKYKVHNMGLPDFKNFKLLYQGANAPFIYRKINDDRDSLSISKCVQMEYRQGCIGELFFKHSLSEEFKSIKLSRRSGKFPESLVPSRSTSRAISVAKHKDLLDLLQFIPSEFHGFYRSIKSDDRAEDFPNVH